MKKLGKKILDFIKQSMWLIVSICLSAVTYKLFHAQPLDIAQMLVITSIVVTAAVVFIGGLSNTSPILEKNPIIIKIKSYVKDLKIFKTG